MNSFHGNGFNFPLGNHTYVMGILNITPDSFSDGGLYMDSDIAVLRALEIQHEGADILDIGAVSTRPGHTEVSVHDELERLAPVLHSLKGKLSIPISVDTFNPQTAAYALENGACMVNDVSGEINPDMAQVVLKSNAGWIITHTGGGSSDSFVHYDDVLESVNLFFEHAAAECLSLGLKKQSLCFDVGFGFGKKHEDNLRLLAKLDRIQTNGVALMSALSRKRLIGEATGCDTGSRLAGTLAANTAAVCFGADIIRVHDVQDSVLAAKMTDAIRSFRNT